MADRGQQFVFRFYVRFSTVQFIINSEPSGAGRDLQDTWNERAQNKQGGNGKKGGSELS